MSLKREHVLSVFTSGSVKLTTREIRKSIRRQNNFPKFTKKDLNRFLHELKEGGVLIRDKDDKWSIIDY